MPHFFLLTAAVSMAITCGVHVLVGGKYVARPLLVDKHLPRAAKWLSYYCWHLVSLMLLGFALALGWSAFHGGMRIALIFTAIFFAACAGLSAICALKGQIHPLRFPSTTLFFLNAVFVATDLVLHR